MRLHGIDDTADKRVLCWRCPAGPMDNGEQFAHVNCIPVNATAADYSTPGPDAIRAFRDLLFERGISNSVRAERGDDIAAACGQLRTRFEARRKVSM